jgi:catechol 2,3-dioxygenase-like lactoylglutathione lyase family enzyme
MPRRPEHVPAAQCYFANRSQIARLEAAARLLATVSGMDLTVSRCFVQVHDPDLALGFYRDALGLELRNDVAREGFRWITVGAASQPGVEIVLTNYLHGSPADVDALAALLAKGALNGVHFHADDLDAAFEQVRAAGAEVVQEPAEQPWGTRDCAVRDPSGNLVRIDQAPVAARAGG